MLAKLNPRTLKITVSRYNLPPRSGIHSFTVMADGNAWFALENANELAHFNLAQQRFDKFVQLPAGGAHWVTYVPTDSGWP